VENSTFSMTSTAGLRPCAPARPRISSADAIAMMSAGSALSVGAATVGYGSWRPSLIVDFGRPVGHVAARELTALDRKLANPQITRDHAAAKAFVKSAKSAPPPRGVPR
jgi:hypothetical protein